MKINNIYKHINFYNIFYCLSFLVSLVAVDKFLSSGPQWYLYGCRYGKIAA